MSLIFTAYENDRNLKYIDAINESQPLLGNSGPHSSIGDYSRRGDCEKMRVLAHELIFTLPCKLESSSRALTNFDDNGYNSALVA
ncbi:hypothetical protein Tco_1307997 [Tanacetum coccineum]